MPPSGCPSAEDFEVSRRHIEQSCRRQGFEPRPFDPGPGSADPGAYEALLVTELVIADLSFAPARLIYELGVRHGAGHGATLLIADPRWLPPAGPPLPVHTYRAGEDPGLDPMLESIRGGTRPNPNPLLEVTGGRVDPVAHQKVDRFLAQLDAAGAPSRRVRDALGQPNALDQLRALRDELLRPGAAVSQRHSALLAVFLGLREKQAYAEMLDLYAQFPEELKRAPVCLEQRAFALNRRAEATSDRDASQRLRQEALDALDALPPEKTSSETLGIRGRIYKGQHDQALARGDAREAEAALDAAIEAYMRGMWLDPRDTYPGVNAVTLLITRGAEGDEARLAELVPLVRFAVDRSPPPTDANERYWRCATQLELACADREFEAAQHYLEELVQLGAEAWMYGSSASNLRKQATARADEERTARELARIIDAVESHA